MFNQAQWHEAKLKQHIWDALIIYAKMTWKRCWNKSRLVASQKRPCYVASTRRGVLGEFFVDGMTCTWIGTGEGIVGREVWPPWGLGGLGGVGVVLGRGRVLVFMWRCSHARGVSPPLCEGV